MTHTSLQTIQTMLSHRFAPENISTIEATKIIHEAFPNTLHKRMSKGGVRSTYIVGVEMSDSRTESQEGAASMGSEEREQLHRQIQELGQVEDLQRQVQELQQLMAEAEKVLYMATESASCPNTVSRMANFGLDTIVADLETYSPARLHLFHQLGDTSRNRRMDGCLCGRDKVDHILQRLLFSMVLVRHGVGKQARQRRIEI